MPKRILTCTVGLSRPISPSDKSKVGTVHVGPGEVDLSKAEIADLEPRDVFKTAEAGAPAPKPAKPTGEKLTAAIVGAIEQLDPDAAEAFNRDGQPSVYAIEATLGFDINQQDRDRAWEAYQKRDPDLLNKGGQDRGQPGAAA